MIDERKIERSDRHYTPIAASYTTSKVHAEGADLARMVEVAGLAAGARVLDVGTGTGHTGLAFAANGANVIGLDLTPAMLRQAFLLAEQRDLRLGGVIGYAERLPFGDGSFDAVACRYCAHHFIDVPAALHEMRRVLRPGGVIVFVDHVAPEEDTADAFVNRLDWLRDPSHRREPRFSEYEAWFTAARFALDLTERWPLRIDLDDWFARARTAPERAAEVRAMLAAASPALRQEFAITDDPPGFNLHSVLLRAWAA
jgi:ubiquinone/menaquinone biosynthesis C-methylase UbiE